MKFYNNLVLSTLCLALGVQSVDIVSMDIPQVAESGKDLVLDCKFEYRPEEEDQLDIKWYFNNSPTPIYQWLPAMDTGPQIIDPRFNQYMDLMYTVNGEKYEKHRALHLVNITHHLSGSYMCKVSSFLDEDFNQKNLMVYVPPAVVKFSHQSEESEGETEISCTAEGIYPTPAARIYWKDGLGEREMDKTVVEEDSDGLYSILVSTSTHTESIRGVQLGCEISIPGTQFKINEELVISPEISLDDLELETFNETLNEPYTDYELYDTTNSTLENFLYNETDVSYETTGSGSGDVQLKYGELYSPYENSITEQSADPRVSGAAARTAGKLLFLLPLLLLMRLTNLTPSTCDMYV